MTLDEIRVEIDAVDGQMKPLFLKRMECARSVAETKEAIGGEVFVPEREQAIIEKRAGDTGEFYDMYVAFLRYLISVSRYYQYGFLSEMQERALSECLGRAGLDRTSGHRQVEISFCCKKSASNLNLYFDMVKLNGISIDDMKLCTEDGIQKVRMILDGNLGERRMRRLICQLYKETEQFAVVALRS
ncbi:hypothetical protein F220043C3_38440 [Enterocloster asparagiformis]|uniref:chorismate mutase n=1 Tax=Enterocloster asparagiformis TaxID=333367 RepID=UPI0034BD14B9